MKKYIFQLLVPMSLLVFVLASCDDYLDVKPKGKRLLETVDDYNAWLNNHELEGSLESYLNMLADNVDYPGIPNPPTYDTDRIYIYTWQDQFVIDPQSSTYFWDTHYAKIYYFNAVINGIDEANGGTEAQKRTLKSEALLGRALEYLYLVNLYGKVYNPNTADQDLAVPFVTSTDVTDPVPNRSTVQDIYDHIIDDINAAISDLPEDNRRNTFRGSVASAYSVLARTYLYMGDYENAAQNAQLALDNGPDTILDYREMSSDSDINDLIKRSDAIYARYSVTYYPDQIPTTDFLQSFDPTDLRLQFFYANLGDYSFDTRGETRYLKNGVSGGAGEPNWGTSVAEMRLILAEAAARTNDLPTAIAQLDFLRKKRFKEIDYVKYDPVSPVKEDVLQKVLDERTFEFPYNGLRWYDMRRLDAEGRMPLVERHDGTGNVMATLPPGSYKYTLQIPIQVMYFHPDWTQNPAQ